MIWHSTDTDEILIELDTDENCGLSADDVAKRRQVKKVIAKPSKNSPFVKAIIKLISAPLSVALFVVGALGAVIGLITRDQTALINGIAVIICLAVYDLMCVARDLWAEGQVKSFLAHRAKTARVLRDGKVQKISAGELVRGDILIVKKGDLIPADARIISCTMLKCNQYVINGDTVEVIKNADTVADDIAPLEERNNMLFYGCSVTSGRGIAVVTELNEDTELEKINLMKAEADNTPTPIQAKLASFTRDIALITAVICVFVFISGFILNLWSTNNFLKIIKDNALISISLGVAAIPFSLSTLVTVCTALGIHRMYKRGVVITAAEPAEKLSEISLICADKTGTITKGSMTVAKVFDGVGVAEPAEGGEISPAVSMILKMGAACCDVSTKFGSYVGDETEIAIMDACKTLTGVSKEDLDYLYVRMGQIPFDADRKMMTTVNMVDGNPVAIVKGAPDEIIKKCTTGAFENALEANNAMCDEGLRVIAIAMKPLGNIEHSASPSSETVECDLRFIGLIGLNDPPRNGVVTAIKKCKNAGIKTVMLTGDQQRTAVAVARKVGILTDESEAITGEAVAQMSDEALLQILPHLSVISRLTPNDKARVVSLYQQLGYKVAVSGDDLSDVPALSVADVGFGLSVSGNDIALNASNVQILDDSFETMVGAVEEGRGICKTIERTGIYLLSCCFALLFTILFGTVIFGISPLAPQQIIFIPAVCFLPVITMGTQTPSRRIMYKKPRRLEESVSTASVSFNAVIRGLVFGIFAIIAFGMGRFAENAKGSTAVAYTMAFGVIAFSLIVNALMQTIRGVIAKRPTDSLAVHFISCIVSIIITLIIMVSPIKYLFCFEALNGYQWWAIIFMAIIGVFFGEIIPKVREAFKKKKGVK